MPDAHPLEAEPKKKRGCLGVLGWIALIAVAAGGAGLIHFWRMAGAEWWRAYQQAQTVAAKCEKVLNFTPEIRIDNQVVIAANTPKFEVVTVQKQAVLRHAWSHSWLHSTKTFDIEATFTAKAGYDLTNPFHIQIDPRTLTAKADLPPAKILSLEMKDIKILVDEDGLWNKLTPEDRQEAFRELEKEARKNFEQSDLLEAAHQEMEKRLQQTLQGANIALPPKN